MSRMRLWDHLDGKSEYDTIKCILKGLIIVTSPIWLPLYILGAAIQFIWDNHD